MTKEILIYDKDTGATTPLVSGSLEETARTFGEAVSRLDELVNSRGDVELQVAWNDTFTTFLRSELSIQQTLP